MDYMPVFDYQDITAFSTSWNAIFVVSIILGAVGYRSHLDSKTPVKSTERRFRKRRMTNMGHTTLVTEVETNLSIGSSLLPLEEPVTFEEVLACLRIKMRDDTMFERLRSTVNVNSKKFIESKDFDPEPNMQKVQLEQGQTPFTFLESVHNTPLDATIPLWKCYVIENYDGKGYLCWRVHHCIGDGMSMAACIMKLCDPVIEPTGDREEPDKSKSCEMPSPPKQHIKKKTPSPLHQIIRVVPYLIWNVYLITYKSFLLVFKDEPLTIFKQKGGQKKRLRHCTGLKVSQIKAIGKKHGATLNDVMLSCVAGAMRSVLAAHDSKHLREDLELRCAIPVNMRSASKPIHRTGNKFSSLLVSLPVGIASTTKRLEVVVKEMTTAKTSLEKQWAYLLSHYTGYLPRSLLNVLVYFMTRNVSVACTNVRGAPLDLTLCGRRVLNSVTFMPPPPSVNLGIAITSIGEELMVSFAVDEKVLEEPQEICDAFLHELKALETEEAKSS